MRVSSAGTNVENPFAARARSWADESQSIAVPPMETGVPKSYQNPFARRSARPRLTTPRLQPGPLSRWHRPIQPPAAPVESRSVGSILPSTQPAAEPWDLLAPLTANEERAALFALPDQGDSPNGPAPPDPSHFGTSDLQQPAWLVPNQTDSANTAEEAAHYVEQPQVLERSPAPEQSPADPFGDDNDVDSAAAEVVVSDESPRPIAVPHILPPVSPSAQPLPSPTRQDASEWYSQAEQAAGEAESVRDLAGVVRLCQQGMACRPQGEMAASLRSLAAWACNRCGELESDDRREDEAMKAFELAIQWDPNCWLALHNRAVSRAQQGDPAGALGDFNRTLELNPGLAVAYRNRGELLAAMGRTEEAVADYNRVLAQLPQEADLYTMRGHALHRLGRYDEALADLGRSIELGAQDAAVYAHRGNVYAEIGQFERAIADFRQALALDAESADAYRSLAWLLATCPDPRFRDPRQALESAERAAQLSAPGDPFVLDALAAAHANAGQFDRAVRYQQEAMSNAPDNFAQPFAARLALYQKRQAFRNGASGTADEDIRAASLEASPRSPRQQ